MFYRKSETLSREERKTIQHNKMLNRICKECSRENHIPSSFCKECWKDMKEVIKV